MKLIFRILLSPFTIFYFLIIRIRNKMFDYGILKSEKFDIPLISVGNLSMGGTGKTPHTEYIANLISSEFSPIAILSRGYKRKTKGFIIADDTHTHYEIGDEPCQYKRKFNSEKIIVAVDSNRKRGIKKLIELYPNLKAIILDDAYQHRYVKPGLNILLSDYYAPFYKDYLLPIGNLRECRLGFKRADMIVITKSTPVISPLTRRHIKNKIKLKENQSLFFSKIKYENRRSIINENIEDDMKHNYSYIFIFSGVANPYPLSHHLKSSCLDVVTLKYPDHHIFSINDINKITNIFNSHLSKNKILVTTEKDFMRLKDKEIVAILKDYPVYYVPINIEFDKNDKEDFNNKIIDYVRTNNKNN